MSKPKRYIIRLTDEEVSLLTHTLHKKDTSNMLAKRCRILLQMDIVRNGQTTYKECASVLRVSTTTISTVLRNYTTGGLDAVLKKRASSPGSDNSRRKMDGRMEATLVEIACGPAPEGHSRWTLRLLEEQMKAVLEEPISRETIRRTLKKPA